MTMTEKIIKQYGSWKSPITSDLIITGTIGLSDIALDDEDVYWTESRPSEDGRSVIVRWSSGGSIEDVTPAGFNARTAVHEYGGGAFVVANGSVLFSNFADQRIYEQTPGSMPDALTLTEHLRYADAVFDRGRNRLICVREDHTAKTRDAINTIAVVDLEGESSTAGGKVIVSGNDFYSSPRLSPDGNRLAWLTWNHPNMPWDGTELWVGEFDEKGVLREQKRVAGGASESIFQPDWSPGGVLHFVSDRSGWWNLYRLSGGTYEALCPMEAEFGAPQWVFRMSTYAFESDSRIVCAFNERGTWGLATIDTGTLEMKRLDVPHTDISTVRAIGGEAFYLGGTPTESPAVVRVSLESGAIEVLRRSSSAAIAREYLSVPVSVEFPTEGGKSAYAFFYAAANRDFAGPADEKPPLIVISHGGPTGASTATLRLSIQYWTSRGIGVVDVNYGGSSGFGRAYRERLNGKWGIVDVDDCVNAARYLTAKGEADGDRLMIRGGSAGGYTTLAALTFRDVFKAGASYYGVSDLEALEQDCHKFESRYNTSLVGPYPERRDVYRQRSPIHFVERMSCPIIIFQGLEDKVVPPNQAEMMFEAVRKKGIPVAYVPFEGEQHGFRRAENIKLSLDAELYFYSKVFGFEVDVRLDSKILERFYNFSNL
jgi:dipeptidyl aminopeptidase/acylaminoacyl peptidase